MRMSLRSSLTTAAAVALLSAPYAQAQTAAAAADPKPPRIAVIDMGRVSSESKLGKSYAAQIEALRKDIDARGEGKQKELEGIDTSIKTLQDELDKQSTALSPEAQERKRQEIVKKNRDRQAFIEDSQGELQRLRERAQGQAANAAGRLPGQAEAGDRRGGQGQGHRHHHRQPGGADVQQDLRHLRRGGGEGRRDGAGGSCRRGGTRTGRRFPGSRRASRDAQAGRPGGAQADPNPDAEAVGAGPAPARRRSRGGRFFMSLQVPAAPAPDAPAKLPIDIGTLIRRIPSQYPFILVDRILEYDPKARLVASKTVTAAEEFFEGHFPGAPVMPGVLLLESLAQAAGIWLLEQADDAHALEVHVVGIDDAKFRRPVVPGDRLRLEVSLHPPPRQPVPHARRDPRRRRARRRGDACCCRCSTCGRPTSTRPRRWRPAPCSGTACASGPTRSSARTSSSAPAPSSNPMR